jgi:ketol-acid reductoisomerase
MGRADGRPRSIDPTVLKRMRSVLQEIRSGQFAREFIREMKRPPTRNEHLLREAEKQPIEKVGARLREMMAWRAKM